MEFEENNEEFEGKRTRNLKEKHREFFTRVKKKFEIKKKRKKEWSDIVICGQMWSDEVICGHMWSYVVIVAI